MDWENLKFFLAVARAGSLAGAGRRLGVKHSTVLRRIAALEEGLGLKLFDHHPGGYALTAAGQEMLNAAAPVEDDLLALERRLAGRDLRVLGLVRITALEPLIPWICDALVALHSEHPGIQLDVSISTATANLARHESDIAIRVSRNPPDNLVGRRIATLLHAVYAAEGHAAAQTAESDLGAHDWGAHDWGAHDWISYDESRASVPQAQWVASHVPAQRVRWRVNHTGMMLAAARAGLGLAVLPCYLGDRTPGLRRLMPVAGLGQDMWLLTHRDLQQTPRIRAVMDGLTRELLRHRHLIQGDDR